MSDAGERDDGVKHLTVQNWLDPDETGLVCGEVDFATGERRAVSGDGWAELFLAVELGTWNSTCWPRHIGAAG